MAHLIPKGADPRILTALRARDGAPGRVAGLVLCGLVVAAVLGAGPLRRWTEGLADSDATAFVQDAAAGWDAVAGRWGGHVVYDGVRAVVRALEAGRF
jgi:hypothetical protein